jgi:hypothetical protein
MNAYANAFGAGFTKAAETEVRKKKPSALRQLALPAALIGTPLAALAITKGMKGRPTAPAGQPVAQPAAPATPPPFDWQGAQSAGEAQRLAAQAQVGQSAGALGSMAVGTTASTLAPKLPYAAALSRVPYLGAAGRFTFGKAIPAAYGAYWGETKIPEALSFYGINPKGTAGQVLTHGGSLGLAGANVSPVAIPVMAAEATMDLGLGAQKLWNDRVHQLEAIDLGKMDARGRQLLQSAIDKRDPRFITKDDQLTDWGKSLVGKYMAGAKQ